MVRLSALALVLAGCGQAPAPPVAPPAPSGPCAALPAAVTFGAVGELDQRFDAPVARVVLMGGGAEVDRASKLFVEAAAGGDVLVLRATGSTESYTSYFANDLAADPAPSSVTTLLLDDPALAADDAVLCRVQGAEAIWLAGGDQQDYLGRWPGELRDAIATQVARGAAVGGTSAGAMAFAGLAFDASQGSVTSEEALAAPAASAVHVAPSPIAPAAMAGVVVDTHFVTRDREGRLLAFLAHALDVESPATGLGLDEQASLVVEDHRFTMLGDGAQAFVYASSGPADMSGALELHGTVRAALSDGDSGAWPPSLEALGGAAVEVVGGVVQ